MLDFFNKFYIIRRKCTGHFWATYDSDTYFVNCGLLDYINELIDVSPTRKNTTKY